MSLSWESVLLASLGEEAKIRIAASGLRPPRNDGVDFFT